MAKPIILAAHDLGLKHLMIQRTLPNLYTVELRQEGRMSAEEEKGRWRFEGRGKTWN